MASRVKYTYCTCEAKCLENCGIDADGKPKGVKMITSEYSILITFNEKLLKEQVKIYLVLPSQTITSHYSKTYFYHKTTHL